MKKNNKMKRCIDEKSHELAVVRLLVVIFDITTITLIIFSETDLTSSAVTACIQNYVNIKVWDSCCWIF